MLVAFSSAAAEKTDKQAFKKAYEAYQVAIDAGAKADAVKYAEEAFLLGKKIYGEAHKNTAQLSLNYGRLLKGKEAQKVLKKSLSIHEKIYGKDAFELVDPLMDLASSYAQYGKSEKPVRYYRQALALVEKYDSPTGILAATLNLEIGQVILSESQSRRSLRYLKRAKEVFMALEGDQAEVGLAKTKFWLGKYRLATQSYKKATTELQGSLALLSKYAPNASITLSNHAFLIEAYEKQGLRDEATKHCQAIGAAKPHNPNQDYMPVYKLHPTYPEAANRAGKEGYVVVSVTVNSEGFVVNEKVLENGGSSAFEKAALTAVKKFRYAPRYVDGKPVDTAEVKYKFAFTIDH